MRDLSINEERISAEEYIEFLKRNDLGVARNYERQGIATGLMRQAHELAGGEKEIAVSVMRLCFKMDAGDVLIKKKIAHFVFFESIALR